MLLRVVWHNASVAEPGKTLLVSPQNNFGVFFAWQVKRHTQGSTATSCATRKAATSVHLSAYCFAVMPKPNIGSSSLLSLAP